MFVYCTVLYCFASSSLLQFVAVCVHARRGLCRYIFDRLPFMNWRGPRRAAVRAPCAPPVGPLPCLRDEAGLMLRRHAVASLDFHEISLSICAVLAERSRVVAELECVQVVQELCVCVVVVIVPMVTAYVAWAVLCVRCALVRARVCVCGVI